MGKSCFPPKEISELSLLALLHDIGKVSIDPNILKKPGSLSSEEWKEMQVLSLIPLLPLFLLIAFQIMKEEYPIR